MSSVSSLGKEMEKLHVSDKDSEEAAPAQGSGASGGGESKRKQLRKMSSKRRSSKQG